MKIVYSKKFIKQYKKLSAAQKQQVKSRIALWQKEPHNPKLRCHRLIGKLSHLYSINITGDIRALYEIIDGNVYLYQFIGSHAQLYG